MNLFTIALICLLIENSQVFSLFVGKVPFNISLCQSDKIMLVRRIRSREKILMERSVHSYQLFAFLDPSNSFHYMFAYKRNEAWFFVQIRNGQGRLQEYSSANTTASSNDPRVFILERRNLDGEHVLIHKTTKLHIKFDKRNKMVTTENPEYASGLCF